MALSNDILNANALLSTLTEEQKSAIVTLSKNDEETVIAQKTGEIYGGLDNDILSTSGIAKDGTEKTYLYAKRVIGDLKARADAADGLQAQIDTLNKEKTRLEGVIAKGGNDTELAKQLKQAQADLAKVTGDFNTLNNKYQEQETRHAQELLGARVDTELNAARAGLKYKAGITENVARVLVEQAMTKIKAMGCELIDDGKGNGGKMLVFKDSEGAIRRNAANQLNPYTPAELLMAELETLDVLDKGRKQEGAGTHTPPASSTEGDIVITNAKTQTEAMDEIKKALMARGLVYGTSAYQDAMDKAWKDNNVAKMPQQ